MRLLVVGAGSTGGYVGGRLTQAGNDVTFLVRPARARQLRESGLHIVSPHGDATVMPQVITANQISQTYDAVLLTVKQLQLDAALNDVAPAIGTDTMILPVLNGMRHMELLTQRFAARNVVGCVLKVATVLEDDGRIVQLAPIQDLAYGELDGKATARIKALDAFMKRANIGARWSTTIEREMWEKWILLASLGAITCLMRGTVGEIEAAVGGTDFALRIINEIVAIVQARGVPPSDSFLSAAREQLTARGSDFASSMFRDVQRGRPTEVEAIIGDLVRRGAEAQIETPLLSAAYTHLSLYQNKVVP